MNSLAAAGLDKRGNASNLKSVFVRSLKVVPVCTAGNTEQSVSSGVLLCARTCDAVF